MAKKRKVDEEVGSLAAKPDAYDPVKIKEEEEEEEDDDEEEEEEEEEEEQVEEEEEEEDITKILEVFNKEQLIGLLRLAAANDRKVVEEIHRIADGDPTHRKLFVHGLGWETTAEKLRDVFSIYGELEDCKVILDKGTGKSKGYGFLVYKHHRAAQKALKEPQKKIDNRMTACQLASAGPVNTSHAQQTQQPQTQPQPLAHSNYNPFQDSLPRKIYVGNVKSDIPADRLLAFFSKYGEIEEGPLGFDKQTGKSKGFALFIYKTVEGARKALEEPSKSFEGQQLYCQKATDNKLKAAAAAAAGPVSAQASAGFNALGGVGFNAPSAAAFGASGGAGYNAPDGAMGQQASALLSQGILGSAMPFGQGVNPNQAALALLAAATGQNPAAFGIPPGAISSFNPGFGAGMNAGTPPVVSSSMPQSMPVFGMGNPGYQNSQPHQVNSSYQSGPMGHAPASRPYSATGHMGGYGQR